MVLARLAACFWVNLILVCFIHFVADHIACYCSDRCADNGTFSVLTEDLAGDSPCRSTGGCSVLGAGSTG